MLTFLTQYQEKLRKSVEQYLYLFAYVCVCMSLSGRGWKGRLIITVVDRFNVK